MSKKKTLLSITVTILAFSLVSVSFPFNIYLNPQILNNNGVVNYFLQVNKDNSSALVQTLRDALATVNKQITEIQTLTNNIGILQGNITNLQGQVRSLNGTLNALTNQLKVATVTVGGPATTAQGTCTTAIEFASNGVVATKAVVDSGRYTAMLANHGLYAITLFFTYGCVPSTPGSCVPSNSPFMLDSSKTSMEAPPFSC